MASHQRSTARCPILLLGSFCLLLISAALVPGLQAQQAMTAAYHVMVKDADGNVTCQMMSPAAAAELGLILNDQTQSLQPLGIFPQQGSFGLDFGGGPVPVIYDKFVKIHT